MTLKQFIEENKEELDRCIHRVVPNVKLDYNERRLWIINDEFLYHRAKSCGCKI